MRTLRLLAVVLAGALCAAAPGCSQQSPAVSPAAPEAAARQYFAAMRASDWKQVAALTHPDALREFSAFFRTLPSGAGASDPFFVTLFGVRDAAEFSALAPEEAYARMLAGITRQSPEMRQAMTSMNAEVIGHVTEGSEVAHVVYRLRMDVQDMPMSRMAVLGMRRSRTGWLALLPDEIQGMIAQGRREFGGAAQPRP